MSTRSLIAGIPALAVALLLWIWISDRHDTAEVSKAGTPTESTAVSAEIGSKATPSDQAVDDAVPIKPPPASSRPEETSATEALPSMSNPETPRDAGNPVENYLTQHDRDARSLLQAFRVTKNRDYLSEALKRFPNDPIVLLHSALYNTAPTEGRKTILLKLQQLLPDDGVPSYLLGEQLLQEGDVSGALDLLIAASLKPYAYNYANEMIGDAQQFLEASGVPADDALAQASFNLELRLLTPMLDLVSLVQDVHADLSSEDDGETAANTWAIIGSRLAQSMQSQMSKTLVEELSSMSAEKTFLSLLSPETELVAGGTTVAQRTKEIEEFHALVRSLPIMTSDALALPPEEKRLFFEKVQAADELSALLWLNGRDQGKEVEIPNR